MGGCVSVSTVLVYALYIIIECMNKMYQKEYTILFG